MRWDTINSLKRLGFSTYRAYLLSDLWKENREKANLVQECYVCGSKYQLQTHHINYIRIGHEAPRDLIILCKPHHRGTHAYMKRDKKATLLNAHRKYKVWLEAGPGVKITGPIKKRRKKKR